jgi:hypothetical protein
MMEVFKVLDRLLLSSISDKAVTSKVSLIAKFRGRHTLDSQLSTAATVTSKLIGYNQNSEAPITHFCVTILLRSGKTLLIPQVRARITMTGVRL